MTDYKNHLEQFVADLYKKIDEEDKKRESKNIVDKNYEKIERKLSVLINKLEKRLVQEPIQILDNSQFIELMGISQKLAQTWRDNGVISFSQVGNKIYYRISDIQELLNKTYRKSTIL
jgi:predicted flap endonuclease-1-like 5' DNA nuclease